MKNSSEKPDHHQEEQGDSPEFSKSKKADLIHSLSRTPLIIGVSEQYVEQVISFLKGEDPNFRYVPSFQFVDADELAGKKLEDLWELSNKNVVITNIDLADHEQSQALKPFRSAKFKTRELLQVLITKPGTTENIPSDHACFNWPEKFHIEQ